MKNENRFYVYLYRHPVTLQPLYIGKGCGERYKKHITQAKNNSGRTSRFICKIKSMIEKENLEPVVEFVQENMLESDAYDLETKLIEQYGRIDFGGILYNMVDGGMGFNAESSKFASDARNEKSGNPFAGEAGSVLSKKVWAERTQEELDEFSRVSRETQLKMVANGTHPFTKELMQSRIVSGNHPCTILRTCKYCGETGKGVVIDRNHNDNCKENPNYNPLTDTTSKWWKLTNIKTGEVFEVHGLTKICKEFNLNSPSLSNVASGKRKQHKGFTCESINPPKESK